MIRPSDVFRWSQGARPWVPLAILALSAFGPVAAQTYGLRHSELMPSSGAWNECRSWDGAVPDAFTAVTLDGVRTTVPDAVYSSNRPAQAASLTINSGGGVDLQPGAQLVITGNTETPASTRRYDEHAWLTTHNAHAAYAYEVLYAQQSQSITEQLQGGVRALMLDVYKWDNPLGDEDVYLCHGNCDIPFINPNTLSPGSGIGVLSAAVAALAVPVPPPPALSLALIGAYVALDTEARMTFSEGLSEVRSFLDTHPDAIVTLILEDYVGNEHGHISDRIRGAGLDGYLYDPATDHPDGSTGCWPPVEWMRESGKRLVVLVQDGTADLDGKLLGQFAYAVENTYDIGVGESNYNPACTNRGESASLSDPSRELFIMNHFASIVLPTEYVDFLSDIDSPLDGIDFDGSGSPNHYDRLLARVDNECWDAAERYPNFLAVDFYNEGGAGRVVNEINSRWEPSAPNGWAAPGSAATAVASASASATAAAITVSAEAPTEAVSFAVEGAAPNPTRGLTSLAVTLPQRAPVAVQVYDMVGRQVSAVDAGDLGAGSHRIALDLSRLPAGVYIYRLTAGSDIATGRLTTVR